MENNCAKQTEVQDEIWNFNAADRSPAVWKKRERILLMAALAVAGCYFFTHFPGILQKGGHFPGIGFTLSQWALAGCVLGVQRKQLRIKGNYGGLFLLAVSLSLGACFARFANDSLRAMNLTVAWFSTGMALCSLTGVQMLPALSGKGMRLFLSRAFSSFFVHWPMPLRVLAQCRRKGESEKLRGLGVGLILGLPASILALALFSSADRVFSDLVKNSFQSLDRLDGLFLIQLFGAAIGALGLFSCMYSACEGAYLEKEDRKRSVPSATATVILSMLCAVYALFAYIQFRYLFFGDAHSVNYAEYARSGFFQLVALAVLTVFLIMFFLSLESPGKAVRSLCALLAALTLIVDFSAFFRMKLYIGAYGLSILRLVTLWGMGMIFCALLACAFKCVLPQTRICPTLTAIALCTWLGLNWMNPDRLVARYQVNAYNKGELTSLDVEYLASLSPDVLPALKGIQDPILREKAAARTEKTLKAAYPGFYDWSLSWLAVQSAEAEEQ